MKLISGKLYRVRKNFECRFFLLNSSENDSSIVAHTGSSFVLYLGMERVPGLFHYKFLSPSGKVVELELSKYGNKNFKKEYIEETIEMANEIIL